MLWTEKKISTSKKRCRIFLSVEGVETFQRSISEFSYLVIAHYAIATLFSDLFFSIFNKDLVSIEANSLVVIQQPY